MLQKLLLIGVLIFTISTTVKADFEGSYMKIDYIDIDENGLEYIVGSSHWNCGEDNSMYRVYYKTDEIGVGISDGSYADEDEVFFEMPCYLRLTKFPDRILLSGILRAYKLEGSTIVSGSRNVIYQDIFYNKEIKLRVKPSEDAKEVGINIMLVKEKPISVYKFNGPISLRTRTIIDGKYASMNRNTNGAISEQTVFHTSIGKKRDDGYYEKVSLLTEILLPNYPEKLETAMLTELIFKRIYKVDTLISSEKEFTADITYISEYKKKVELIPGETLLLVFPSDTPSVRGFNRVDTLVIKP